MRSQNDGYVLFVMNASIISSYLVTSICNERWMNTLPTTIDGDHIEVSAKSRHVQTLRRHPLGWPTVSSPSRFSVGYIMCIDGLPNKPDLVFAPYTPSRMVQADADAIFEAGWNEDSFHFATMICSLFNFYNRLIDGYGVKNTADFRLSRGQALAEQGYRIVIDALKR